jgi:stage V sporulation protein B
LKKTKIKINMVSVFLKPLIASLLCAVSAYTSYEILTNIILINTKISTIFSIIISALIYIITLFTFKTINENDLKTLPKGEKIACILKKLKIV